MKFSVTIDRDEDGVWIVECPAISGCVSQGATKDEARANIGEAIKLSLEVRGRAIVDHRNAPDQGCRLMPSSLPVLSGRQVVQIFVALGWHVARQRGSDIPNHKATVSLPDHKKVAKGALRTARAAQLDPCSRSREKRGQTRMALTLGSSI
jgi:predicted RNase H-like HicB family nuclease/predicted RNA binding protein YcfA (HicA-like mRNA interferase family)